MRRVSTRIAVLLLCLLCLGIGTSAPAVLVTDAPLPAYWKDHEVAFVYKGFGTDYSCEGIRWKLRQLLLALGARDDVAIRTGACFSSTLSAAQPSVRVRLKFAAPAVLAQNDPDQNDSPLFEAAWSEEHIRFNHPRFFDLGDCELVEHFRNYVLPLFVHRVLKEQRSCVPGASNTGAPSLKVLVLKSAAGLASEDAENTGAGGQ